MQLANVLLRSVVAACLALTTTWSGALGQASAPAKDYEPQVGQGGKDVIWVPTPQALVDRMMEMAKVTPQDYVIDLGSGDGRTVITAAKLGAKALGIEFNPDMVELSKRNAAKEGVGDKAVFVNGDIFQSDFSQATVVTMFLLSSLNLKLRPILLDMKPGTRVVSNTFNMGDWEADQIVEAKGECTSYCRAFLWIIPAKVEGTWQHRRERADAAAEVPGRHGHAQDRQRDRAGRRRQARWRSDLVLGGRQGVLGRREGQCHGRHGRRRRVAGDEAVDPLVIPALVARLTPVEPLSVMAVPVTAIHCCSRDWMARNRCGHDGV